MIDWRNPLFATAALLGGLLFDGSATAAELAKPDPCSNEAWGAGTLGSPKVSRGRLASCSDRLRQDPADMHLMAAVARIRISRGLFDDVTQSLVDEAFSSGDPVPMTAEIEALVDSDQRARAEALVRRVAALGSISSIRPYLRWLMEHDRETEGIALLDHLDVATDEGVRFLLDLVKSSKSPGIDQWLRQRLSGFSRDQAQVQEAIAHQFENEGDIERARYWHSLSAANGSAAGEAWVVQDLYDGKDATRLVQALNHLGFDAGIERRGLSEQTRRAITASQALTYLSPTGEPDENTLALLALYNFELHGRISPTGALSGIGRLFVKDTEHGLERGTGFLAGDRCTIVSSAHAFDSVESFGHAKFYLGPNTKEPYPNYAFQADVVPVAIGLVFVSGAIAPVTQTDWFVGHIRPCAGSEFVPLDVAANNKTIPAELAPSLYATGFPGDLDASELTVLKCSAQFVEAVDRQCVLRGMSGGPAFVVDPLSPPAGQVVGINTGFFISGAQRYEDLTPAFAFYLAVNRANSSRALTDGETNEILQNLLKHGFITSLKPSDEELQKGLIGFQDKFGALSHPGGELWHDRYGRYYSLRPDEDVLSLVRTVNGTSGAASSEIAGSWCGEDLRLDIHSSRKGWTVGNGREAPSRVQTITTAGRYVSLEGSVGGTKVAYEFYREPDSLELIHVDASASAPYVPSEINGVIRLTRCAAGTH